MYCTDKIYEKTSHIFFSSKLGHGRIPIYFFHKIKPFTNLKILSLEYQKLSGYGVSTFYITYFSSTFIMLVDYIEEFPIFLGRVEFERNKTEYEGFSFFFSAFLNKHGRTKGNMNPFNEYNFNNHF